MNQRLPKEGLLEFLRKLKPEPSDLIEELNADYEFTVGKWIERSEEGWLRRYPNYGDDIYNHIKAKIGRQAGSVPPDSIALAAGIPHNGYLLRTAVSALDPDTNEGVPGTFNTQRKELVDSILHLMERKGLFYIRAPPFCGKTGLCQLLCMRLLEAEPGAAVLHIRCNELDEGESFREFFKRKYKCAWEDFVEQPFKKYLLLDEGQCTYADIWLWKTLCKNQLSRIEKGLHLLVASAYGSFDSLRARRRSGTPIQIPAQNMFELKDLILKRTEFNEMVSGSRFEQHSDIIWQACGAHIGVASRILITLNHNRRPNEQFTPNYIANWLYSDSMIRSLPAQRGFIDMPAVETIKTIYEISDAAYSRMLNVLREVAEGKDVPTKDPDRSPGSKEAVTILLKHGFLFDTSEGFLTFASNAHLNFWLASFRTDSSIWFFDSGDIVSFVVESVSRMSRKLLSDVVKENHGRSRERQIHAVYYNAVTSLVPKKHRVVTEWQTTDRDGYVDIVIRISDSDLWFLELLVDGERAQQHNDRFESYGNYSKDVQAYGGKYALIDFRLTTRIKKRRTDFVYVTFSENYKNATIQYGTSESNSSTITRELNE
ncbi:hypothetical protein MP638_003627 [Amoeboaphelidium occidentale]|nr:hypothetical protein MP638_003627 [Amoeboaphelidium occidentale]